MAPERHKVREVMTPEVKYVYEDESLEDAVRNMSDLQVRRLPVLDREKRLVGIVSLGDLALNTERSAGAALNQISQPN
jgi:CBS domain-containing protein